MLFKSCLIILDPIRSHTYYLMLFFINRPPDCGTGSHHLADPDPTVSHCASVPPQVSKMHNTQCDIFNSKEKYLHQSNNVKEEQVESYSEIM